MRAVLLRIGWRLALCAAVSWAVWRVGGLVPMVFSALLFGIALARPLVDLAGELRHQMRAAVWRPLEGRHFVYRGRPVQVLEDADRRRWVRVADVQAVVGATASPGALALSYPHGWCLLGRPAQPHLDDEALLAHLANVRGAEALRFRRWVEREIAHPGRQLRKRLGIRPPLPEKPPLA